MSVVNRREYLRQPVDRSPVSEAIGGVFRAMPIGGSRAGVLGAARKMLNSVVENYEDAPNGVYETGENITTYYNGDTGSLSRTTTNAVEGSQALQIDTSGSLVQIYSTPGDGLNAYPNEGDTIRWLARDPGPAGGVIVAASAGVDGYLYIVQDGSIDIYRLDNSGYTQLANATPTIAADTWYWAEGRVPSAGDGTLQLDVYELNTNNLTRGSQLTNGSVSTSDSNYTGRGIGMANGIDAATGTFVDDIRVV